MPPIAQPGPLTERERFMFEATGYLVIPNALSPEEVEACLAAAGEPMSRWERASGGRSGTCTKANRP